MTILPLLAARTHLSLEKEQCHLCKKEFVDKKVLKNHMRTHSQQPKQKCEICSKEVSYLKHHVKNVHSKNTQAIICDICGKGFTSKGVLKNHKKCVHTPFPQSFQCNQCEKTFLVETYLRRHVKEVHNDTRIKECEICHKKVKGLKIHMKVHEAKPSLKERTVFCEVCGQGFIRPNYLLVHFAKEHNPDGQNKEHICDICHTVRSSSGQLKKHMSIHKTRTLSCDFCNKKFYSSNLLQRHMKIHKRK